MIKNDALNLANSRIITADDQNFVIDKYGITGKYLDPIDGTVSDEQIRIINNLLCFTDDNWQHTKTALGKITYRKPGTDQYETKYGLIGDTIIGNLLLGEKLIISDQNGYVRIDGNGITLDGGAITWKKPIKESAVDGLTENLSTLKKFKNQVNAALTGNAATDIGSDYVISPKIGGGYLYLLNENNSIILNPHAQSAISQSGLIQANNNMVEIISNKKTVLTVDKQGNLTINGTIHATNGEFTGTINATSGKFTGGLLLDGGYLTTNINRTSYNSQVPGLTLDKNGIGGWNSSEQFFNISNDGKLTAIGAQITGTIAAISGYIGSKTNGWTISNNAIYNGCENMTSVKKGTYIGTSGIKNVINNTCWVSIMNGSISSIGGDFVTEIKNGTINILSDYKINGAGILLKGGNDYESNTYHQTVTIRPSYLDFSKPSKRRSAMGYIHIDADEQSDETGFYLIDSDNLIHGHFYMKNNSNASELMCTDIYCSNLICDHTTSYNGMTINLDQYITTNEVIPETNTYINIIGKSSSSTLWIGHYEKTYQWYTHSIQLNAGSTTSVGTFYTPDGSVSRSDIRLKTEITDIAEDEINFILGLHPKKYKLKDGNSGRYHYGLIAQEVDKLMQNTIGDVGLLVKKEQYVPDDERYAPVDFQDDTTFYYG
ncbi:MAG: tail fiber domain-containing protein, partial [Lachnospiraceae bacterium]|nr:tail fiber domain-containing protein [Lachnospiraceae bacterium]